MAKKVKDMILLYIYFCFMQEINCSVQPSDVQCPTFCKCVLIKKMAMCSAVVPTKHQLRYIPRLPDYVTWLTFTGNRFPNVTRASLVNLTYNSISKLILQQSKITFIAPDAFVDLPYLTHLEINQNPKVSPEMVSKFLPYLNRSIITKLYFKDNMWNNLPRNLFQGLNESNLTTVSFENNQLETVDGYIFSNLIHLQDILFPSNRFLHSFSLKGIPSSVTKLDLSENNFIQFPDFCDGNKSLLPSIVSINLQQNHIRIIHADSFKCLWNLKEIKLDENEIPVLRNNALNHLASIERLSLSNQHNHLERVHKLAFNSSTLTKLDIANNRLKISTPDIFSTCPNLQFLNLAKNTLSLDTGLIRQTFLPLKKLRILILKNVNLRILPPNLFPNLPSLKSLVLTKNSIIGWNDDQSVFGNITWLKKLIFTDNKIKLINKTSFPVYMLSNLSHLDLSDNEFACSCDLMWFRNWIRKNTVILNNWSRGYKCRYPPEINGKLLKDYNPTIESCKEPNPLITIAISLTVVAGAVVAIVIIVYKSRWHIRYWIYLLRAKRQGYDLIEGNINFTYDGFVVYCEEDREWVHNILIPKLEEEKGYCLCVHYRDFDVGKLIVDNIVECMDQSRKIIVVLSNAFAQSEWCQFELRLSHNRFLKTDSRVLVLVMLEEINNRNLTSSLRAIITTTTYAKWTVGGIGNTQFWEQMISAISK